MGRDVCAYRWVGRTQADKPRRHVCATHVRPFRAGQHFWALVPGFHPISANLSCLGLKCPSSFLEESFWINIIGRGYPPTNRVFRWCTQRMRIDPVNALVKQRVGHWGEAILHLGARRAESSTRLRND